MRFLILIADIFYFIKGLFLNFKNHKLGFKKDMEFLNSIKEFNIRTKEDDLEFFLNHIKSVNKNSILLIEMNTFHTETLEALIDYFTLLNFSVDVLIRREIIDFKAFKLDLKNMIYALNSKDIAKYKIVFFNTMILELNTYHSIHSFLNINTKVGGIYHTISDIKKFRDYKNNYFALRNIKYKNISLKGLNLSSNYNFNRNINNNIITFISIGFPIYHRGFKEKLKSIIKYLKKSNISNIRFILVGKEAYSIKGLENMQIKVFLNNEALCENNLDSISLYIYQNPSKKLLHSLILQSHYVLGLYDRFAHRHYLNTSTSGQRQISLGYNVPLIINEPFASNFNFTSKEACIFKGNKDILKAIKLVNSEQYLKLKKNLYSLFLKLREESKNNLEEFLKEVK
ncbi:hypothetical protein [Helicobacter sp. MIT 14-3879]|uniref:hypothetical protein n=1 Tax=Helicobacter sp. MIT 14-3879 TaxID=2040649 RepID=UPI000E1E3253|nr:hypothetical protein [Helicobacter sp. MIT 14-3879]RDU62097.1 hypothetical protein CQA44_07650 [Helicobacter sp. MIT 14-3879]